MDFGSVRQDMVDSPTPSDGNQGDSAPSVTNEPQGQAPSNHDQHSFQDSRHQSLTDLEKLDKFMFGGKEWTPKDLQSAILRQEDYSRKTQELARTRSEFEREQKREEEFRTNVRFDLEKVLRNPDLASEFKRVYPKHYHYLVDDLYEEFKSMAGNQAQPSSQNAQAQQPAVGAPPELMRRIERIEQNLSQREVEAMEKQIDSQWERYSQKYPKANSELALARAHVLIDRKIELSEEKIEELFKQLHESEEAREKQMREGWIKEQKTANSQGRDIGRGGGTPGKAPEKMSFKQARHAMINHPGGS